MRTDGQEGSSEGVLRHLWWPLGLFAVWLGEARGTLPVRTGLGLFTQLSGVPGVELTTPGAGRPASGVGNVAGSRPSSWEAGRESSEGGGCQLQDKPPAPNAQGDVTSWPILISAALITAAWWLPVQASAPQLWGLGKFPTLSDPVSRNVERGCLEYAPHIVEGPGPHGAC